MIRLHKPYGLGKPASKRQMDPYKGENRRATRSEWAQFCTEQCPHEGRLCDRGPCREFKEKFGERKDA